MKLGRLSLFPVLFAGVLSVIYWRISGDLRFYGIVQFYPMLVLPVLLIFRPARYSNAIGTWAMIILYGLAKLIELFDGDLSRFSSLGGHPWKHVLSAAALLCYVLGAHRRKPCEQIRESGWSTGLSGQVTGRI